MTFQGMITTYLYKARAQKYFKALLQSTASTVNKYQEV